MSDQAQPASESKFLDLYRCEACRQPVDRHDPEDGCEWFGLSPLMAWALTTALEIQGDHWVLVAGDLAVPSCARRFVDDKDFCQRMKASAHYLADQLAGGKADAFILRCTADEVNLAMALTDAAWVCEGGALPVPAALRDATVHGVAADADEASDCLFHDHDVFMLWNPMLDGIENDEKTLARIGTTGLHPSLWFEPFNDVEEPIF